MSIFLLILLYLIGALLCCCFFCFLYIFFASKTYNLNEPLNFKEIKKPQKLKYREFYQRDQFSTNKLPEEIDYIVIGAGIGGLTTASILSRFGYVVLVLEQHDRAGGGMHCFEEEGFEFDTGIHYVGNKTKLTKWLDLITHPEMKVEWAQMGTKENDYCYDRIYMGEHGTFDYCGTGGAMIDDLKNEFPKEHKAIDNYESFLHHEPIPKVIWGLSKILPQFISKILIFFSRLYYPHHYRTWKEYLDNLPTTNEKLKLAMCGNLGDLGGISNKCAHQHTRVQKHYDIDGGWYFVGGPDKVTQGIIPVIERSGGRVLVRALVTDIITSKSGKAMGVRVQKRVAKNQDVQETISIRANRGVISACGYKVTQKLLGTKTNFPPPATHKDSVSHISLFIGLRGDTKELNLPSHNCWVMGNLEKGWDYDRHVLFCHREFINKEKKTLAFMGFPGAKDPTFHDRHPDKSVCLLLSELPYHYVREWEKLQQGKRGGEYDYMKKLMGNYLLENVLYKLFPQCRDRVEFLDIGTPLSTNHYLGTIHGESYGLDHNVDRMNKSYEMRVVTNIDNLWLTGQDVVCLGFAAGLAVGELTAGAILGYYDMPAMYAGKNLWKDLEKLPKLEPRDFKTIYTKENPASVLVI